MSYKEKTLVELTTEQVHGLVFDLLRANTAYRKQNEELRERLAIYQNTPAPVPTPVRKPYNPGRKNAKAIPVAAYHKGIHLALVQLNRPATKQEIYTKFRELHPQYPQVKLSNIIIYLYQMRDMGDLKFIGDRLERKIMIANG